MSKARKKPQQTPEIRLAKIGNSIKSIRKKRGLTQKELAERIGLTREAVAAYEVGRTHLIDTTILDMATALRVSVNEILGQERQSVETPLNSRRWAKRMAIIEGMPETLKKYILRILDDVIKANMMEKCKKN